MKQLPLFRLLRIKAVGLSGAKPAKTDDFAKLEEKGTRKWESFMRKETIFPFCGTYWNKLGKIEPQGQQGAMGLNHKRKRVKIMLCKRKNRAWIRTIAIALLLTMTAWLLPANWQQAEAATLKNPQKGANSVTWDCVYFGHYPQSSDGKGGFKNEPIKWRVLSVNGNDAFLLADKNLDVGSYHKKWGKVTWETCTLRKWLNSTFFNKAFNEKEQSAIAWTKVETKDNYGIEGGNDTQDKVFLLSIEEVMKPAYGFTSSKSVTKTRVAANTAYVGSKGRYHEAGWWLRSPGLMDGFAGYVPSSGAMDIEGINITSDGSVIRPALHLGLSSNLWSYAGTVKCSDKGKVTLQKAVLTKVTSPKSKTLKATWKKDTKASGYQVVIAQNSKFTKGKKTATVIKSSTTSKTFSKLKKKVTYYVKVRAYKTAGKTKLYGAYSSVKKVKIK